MFLKQIFAYEEELEASKGREPMIELTFEWTFLPTNSAPLPFFFHLALSLAKQTANFL